MAKFDIDRLEMLDEALYDRYHNGTQLEEYCKFSLFWQDLFIVSDWIIDTGNFETVNLELNHQMLYNIKRHPFIFRFFRMIFGV
jgi:hypothetical protein